MPEVGRNRGPVATPSTTPRGASEPDAAAVAEQPAASTGWVPKARPAREAPAWTPQKADPATGAFQFQPRGFTPGAKLEVKDGDYKGHGFGGQATVNQFDSKHVDLDVAASAMMGLVKVKVKLKWDVDDAGNVSFFGGRTDKASEPGQPDKVQKALSVKSQSADRTVFELPVEREVKGPDGKISKSTVLQDVLVERASVKGKDALHIKYDAYEMTLVPR